MKQVLVKYPNKLRAVFATRPSRMVSISVSINAGVEQETRSISGVSHLIERLLRCEIIKNVNDFGGVVDTFTDYNQISLTISTQREFLKNAIEVLSSAIFNFYPKIESFEREKKKVLVEIEKVNFNPFAMLNTLTQSIMYKGTNLANDELGSAKSISQLTLEEVKEFYKKILSPDDIIISFVGEVGDPAQKVGDEQSDKQDQKAQYTLTKKQVENYWDYPYETNFIDKNDFKMMDRFNYVQDLVNKYFYLKSMKLTSKARTKNVKYVTRSVKNTIPHFYIKDVSIKNLFQSKSNLWVEVESELLGAMALIIENGFCFNCVVKEVRFINLSEEELSKQVAKYLMVCAI